MEPVKREIYRTRGSEFCSVSIELSEDGRLSICGTKGDIKRSAQRYDDVVLRKDGRAYVAHSWGQIRDDISDFFPEVRPLLPWHLNDLHPGCDHQYALGWGNESMRKPCPVCGYKYGTAWLKRELPPEIVELARTVCPGEDEPK